eukprot:6591642-Lingulodinium_polyedra.AAC.1
MEVEQFSSVSAIKDYATLKKINELSLRTPKLKNLAINIAVNDEPSETQEPLCQCFMDSDEAPINDEALS